jgi:hypothetical protein
MIKRETKSVIMGNDKCKKLFCNCGFIGVVENTSCPDCKKKAEVNIIGRERIVIPEVDVDEFSGSIKYKYEFCMYRDATKDDDMNFKFSKKVFHLRFFKENGVVKLSRSDNCEDPLNGRNNNPIYYADGAFFETMNSFPDLQRDLLVRLAKERDVEYFNVESFIGDNFYKAFTYIRHPKLIYLKDIKFVIPKSHAYNDLIASAAGEIDLVKKLTGHKSPLIRKKIKDPDSFNLLIIVGKYIEHPENALNFIDELTFGTETTTVFDFYNTRYLEGYFEKGMEFIKKLHENLPEKVWTNRILKSFRENPNDKVNVDKMISYIDDIGRMYGKISSVLPDYEIPFDGDIIKLHDTLAVDERKLQTANLPIRYSEDEKKWEKEIDASKEIVLAPNTHYLVEVGTKMNICVGSYNELALTKKCNILVLKEKEEPVVCMEVREKRLVQAKMKHNNRPTGDYRDDVINWCQENNVQYTNCYDIA